MPESCPTLRDRVIEEQLEDPASYQTRPVKENISPKQQKEASETQKPLLEE